MEKEKKQWLNGITKKISNYLQIRLGLFDPLCFEIIDLEDGAIGLHSQNLSHPKYTGTVFSPIIKHFNIRIKMWWEKNGKWSASVCIHYEYIGRGGNGGLTFINLEGDKDKRMNECADPSIAF